MTSKGGVNSDNCAASWGPRTRTRGLIYQYNVGATFERIAMGIAGPFPQSDKRNHYILFAMDYFTTWTEVYLIPNQGCVDSGRRLGD
jgi:hypothetical protein